MSTITPPAAAGDLIPEELAAVRGELARVDAKCGTFASIAGIALGFVLTASVTKIPTVVLVLLGVASVPLVAAALVLLFQVLRPRLGPTGFCRYAGMTPDQIRQELTNRNGYATDSHRAGELVVLSGIALRKNRALRLACFLLGAGLVLVVLAILAGVIA